MAYMHERDAWLCKSGDLHRQDDMKTKMDVDQLVKAELSRLGFDSPNWM